LSLLVQYSISLLGIFAHATFCLKHHLSTKKTKKIGLDSPGENSLPAMQRLNHHLEALNSALVEFQKAQCFFSVTLQIATLTVLSNLSSESQAKDKVLLRLSSANAFSPIALTLAQIDFLSGRDSWYLFILSSVSFILGTLAYWLSGYPEREGYHLYTNPYSPVTACGNMAPIAPCFAKNDHRQGTWPHNTSKIFWPPGRTQKAVWFISFGILAYRLVYRLSKKKQVTDVLASYMVKPRKCQLLICKFQSKEHMRRLLQLWSTSRLYRQISPHLARRKTWDCVQILCGAAAVVAQLASIIQVLVSSLNMINTTMSFGQIVAVGIWVPVFLEYGYLEISEFSIIHDCHSTD